MTTQLGDSRPMCPWGLFLPGARPKSCIGFGLCSLHVPGSLGFDHLLALLSSWFTAGLMFPPKESLRSEGRVLGSVNIHFISPSTTHRAGHTKELSVNTSKNTAAWLRWPRCSGPIWPPGRSQRPRTENPASEMEASHRSSQGSQIPLYCSVLCLWLWDTWVWFLWGQKEEKLRTKQVPDFAWNLLGSKRFYLMLLSSQEFISSWNVRSGEPH